MQEYLFQCLRREVSLGFTDPGMSFDGQVRRFFSKYLFDLLKSKGMTTTDIMEKGTVIFVAIHISTEGPDIQLPMLADKQKQRLNFKAYDSNGRRIPIPYMFEALLEAAMISHNKDLPPIKTTGWVPWEKEFSLEGIP